MSRAAWQVPDEELRPLYEAIERFRARETWRHVPAEGPVGVQDPESGEVGYCCVMGRLKELFGLAVYRGPDGLANYLQMSEAGPGPKALDAVLGCRMLMASFGQREALLPGEREAIKRLGLKYRGRDAWPSFSSYLPFTVPWYLDEAEARFLTLCFQQVDEMASRSREDPALWLTGGGDHILVRVPTPQGWVDQWRLPELPAPVGPSAVALVGEEAARWMTLGQRKDIWEMAIGPSPAPVQDAPGQRPYVPMVVLVVDRATKFILDTRLCPHDHLAMAVGETVLRCVSHIGARPAVIRVDDPTLAGLVEPLAEQLQVSVKVVNRTSVAQAVMRELVSRFG
ncbi:MAG TPA: hypothetical protein VGN26_02395 [Armatimonadota bacterium]